jgi:hypothetical protein
VPEKGFSKKSKKKIDKNSLNFSTKINSKFGCQKFRAMAVMKLRQTNFEYEQTKNSKKKCFK